jgi:hypothetical protein
MKNNFKIKHLDIQDQVLYEDNKVSGIGLRPPDREWQALA